MMGGDWAGEPGPLTPFQAGTRVPSLYWNLTHLPTCSFSVASDHAAHFGPQCVASRKCRRSVGGSRSPPVAQTERK